MAVRRLLAAALVLLAPAVAGADTPVAAAQALVARYHEDLTAIDRARDLLEAAVARDERVETLVALSYVSFLWGDVRAGTSEAKLAAYERGREVGRRAIERAPQNPDAHLWYAINTGRWGQTRGIVRSLFLLPTVREEIDVLLALDPRSPRAHAFAGNVFLELPRIAGGDPERAETHFRTALELDPAFTVARVGLARAHIAAGRYVDARRELQRVIQERAPTLVADWTVKDLPRARALLASIRDRS
jgi:tetratricopeptide (TPR) repeat protein